MIGHVIGHVSGHVIGLVTMTLHIPFEVRAVQDVIHPLMNPALTSDHSSGPIRVNPLDHLELRLDLLPLHCYHKISAAM